MGERGPAPTPTEILAFRGSNRVKGRAAEPKPKKKAPPCPRRLLKAAKVVWHRAVKELQAMGVLTVADAHPLERYCRLYVEEWELAEFVKQYGYSYPLKDNDGKVKCFQQFPQVAQMNRVRSELLKIEMQFGLTPASRTRIQVEAAEKPEGVRTRTRRA